MTTTKFVIRIKRPKQFMTTNASQILEIKKVLIVDDEKLFLASITEGMAEFSDEFEVITAPNGRKALDELHNQEIDLVVTDLKMPVMDGFQLLAEMSNEFSNIPVIVMTAFGTPEMENRIKQFDVYDFLEKPVDYQVIAQKIRDGITHSSEGHLKGIMLFGFLQLLQMEQKTCALIVRANRRKGTLYFSKGELIDAVYNKTNGEKAAQEIICWENAEIEIVNVYKKVKQRITKPLQYLLMDAAKEKDEAVIWGNTDETEDFEFPLSEAESPINPEGSVDKVESLAKVLPDSEMTMDNSKSPRTGNELSGYNSNPENKENIVEMANNIDQSLNELMSVDGAMAVALVDLESGMALGTAGGGVNLEVAAAGNTEVIKSKQKVMSTLGLKDRIEDILISLGEQYHIIRPLKAHNNLFLYLVLGREKSNLAMARFKMNTIESGIQL